MNAAISASTLGKRYRVGERQQYRALRDMVMESVAAPARRLRRLHKQTVDAAETRDATIWALRDASFEIGRGEAVGIIGRNGSGKSTLLKVLSRITKPTTGRAVVDGRVGTLLEVGTGFHPELTGRENIYLNGAILGMHKSEIKARFDEIVAFAEVEKFIDTPVKRYSSGMYVRLAFAVAAHLEPEILLVDEVLAVGDASFQKKCLGKMGDVAGEGRTVLFVSHDMTNVSVLCTSAMLLQSGRVIKKGATQEVIDTYLSLGADRKSSVAWELDDAPGDEISKITAVAVRRPDGMEADSHGLTDSVVLTMDWLVEEPGHRLNPVFIVKNSLGTTVFSTSNFEDREWAVRPFDTGRYSARCVVPSHVLNDSSYTVDALIVEETRFTRASAPEAVEFSVYDDGATRGDFVGTWHGIVRPRCDWSIDVAS